MLDRWRLLFLLVLLASPVELRRASSGGGFSGRGQSSSRGQVAQGGGQFNQGGGGFNQGGQFRPQGQNPSGGFHPGGQQQPHGFQQPHNNFNRGPTNTFHPQPKTSSNTFGKALLGGAAGALGAIVVYEGAKAIIKSASEPFHYQNRAYYWDQNYKGDKSQFECRMPLSQLQQDINKEAATTAAPAPGNVTETTTASSTPPISQTIGNLQFKDGSKPRDITWGCRKDAEVCCGMECCPNPNPPNPNSTGSSHGSGPSRLASILLIIFILLLVCGCCCCIVAYKMCRSAFDCILPREQKYDEQYPQNADYNQQQAQYPMQQYPQHQQQQYPQQNYPQQQPFASSQPYPNYPPQPTSYPPHPTY